MFGRKSVWLSNLGKTEGESFDPCRKPFYLTLEICSSICAIEIVFFYHQFFFVRSSALRSKNRSLVACQITLNHVVRCCVGAFLFPSKARGKQYSNTTSRIKGNLKNSHQKREKKGLPSKASNVDSPLTFSGHPET